MKKTFYVWLKKQINRDDPVEDFAKDVHKNIYNEDKIRNRISAWRSHIVRHSYGFSESLVLDALHCAWIEYRTESVQLKLRMNLRSRLYSALRSSKKTKIGSHIKELGCTVNDLKIYLEKQFKKGMTWKNWSREGWHIDHIMPLASFDLSDKEQFLKACHYTNLQPLWSKENIKKGKKILS